MTKYIVRIIFLAIAAAVAGGLAALFAEMAAAGAFSGFSLSLGILVIHFFCRNRLTRGEPPKWKVVLLASIISGVIAGAGVGLISGWNPHAFLHMLGFSLVLHLAYQIRWRFGIVGFLVAALFASVFCFFDGRILGLAFAVFWLAAIALIDPAWSFERWKKCWPGKVVEGQACALGK